MIIHCLHCGLQVKPTEELNRPNGTSIPVQCECGAKGFTSFMTIEQSKETNNIITMQLFKKIN